jgi:hypothetical protein
MTYPYGTKGAPVVGNGLGGLPRRALPTPAPTPAPTTPTPLLSASFRPYSDRGLGFRVNYNTVISDTVGSYQASGNYSSTIHAVMRNHPMFTFIYQGSGGGNSMWPPGYPSEGYRAPNFVSITYGGESNYNVQTQIFGFAQDFLYRAQSSSANTSVFPGFMIDGDETSFYVFGGNNISKVSKSGLNATITRGYGGSTIFGAWVRGQNLVFVDINGKVIVADKDTLAVVSTFNAQSPSQSAVLPSSGAQHFAQTDDIFVFVGGTSREEIFVIDKATLDLRYHTLSWSSGSRWVHLSVCNNKVCSVTYDATSPGSGTCFEYTATTRRQLFSISGTSWSEQSAVNSGCWFGDDIFTFSSLSQSSQFVANANIEWSFKLSTMSGSVSIPSFSGLSISWSGSSASLSTGIKASASATATATTNTFTTFTRFPYRTFY